MDITSHLSLKTAGAGGRPAHIVLGISGSIAAYKSCTLLRLLIRAGAEVQVVITPAGKEFVTPVTLSALSGKPVVSEFFNQTDGTWHSHVDLGRWADMMVVAPATASSISKMAHGTADNMLITTYLSMKAPVVVAPAMDLDMYAHHTTQQNLQALRRMGVSVIEPATGELASHLMGKGRMEEPENIFVQIATMLRQRDELQGVTVMVTAGPTVERIDPVRYISNDSTGKMGFALAEALAERGANVKLVCGPTALQTVHPGIERIDVQSAAAMYEAATTLFLQCHAAILCAAVADFTPENTSDTKIKRGADDMIIRLKPTQDIAATLGRTKRADQVLVGFALETHDAVEHAKDKLRRKNLDFIVLNSLADPGAGFGYDTNKVTLIDADDCVELPLMAKTEVADHIVEQLCAKLDALHS
ncbi:MAG: bifunctional phosphopantothenoylcysteine decarboxylase/phosphopantothenate--cysteine ligase CoaBC [Bacteroidales bacterium]|nr:bifunctional phosphopantothenoylcysteine decarboxylase/phosphopantothenate--cysteine ligase CoaBC [Bacteroidales bacterium]